MTAFLIQVSAALLLLVVVHVSTLALAGVAFGIQLLEVSFGFGKALFRRGKVTIRALPWGGYAKFADTREAPYEPATAFNHQPAVVQILVYLAGCAALALLAALLLGSAGFSEVIAGFRHLLAGAFAPKSTAQGYLQATHDWWIDQGFLALLGVLAAKMAAFNLLPLPTMNGGQAILALLPTDQSDYPPWQMRLMQIGIVPLLALSGAWMFALVIFATGATA